MLAVNALDTSEKRRLLWLITAFTALTTLPYLWAFAITPPGFVYSGLLFSPDDQNVHLMWARQAAERHLFVHDLFTTEHLSSGEKPLFNNLLTSFIGAFSWLPISLVIAYHVVRLVAGAFCLWWFYQLAAQITENKTVRFFATALAAFSSGGGWLRDVLPFLAGRAWMDKPDNYLHNVALPMMPEGFAFPSLLVFPLNAASLALLALIYNCVLQAQAGEKRALWVGFGAAFLLSNVHTYDALPLGATLLLWAIYSRVKKVNFVAPLVIACGALPPLLYQFYVFQNSREFQLKANTITAPPPLPDVLLSYAPLLLLALYGAWAVRENQSVRLLVLWAVVTLFSIYAPLSFGRKMIEGFHLPLCFFAAVAVSELIKNRTPILQRAAFAGGGVLLCLSSLQFLLWCLADAPKSIQLYRGIMPPLYLSTGDAAAFSFLKEQYSQEKTAKEKPAAVLSLIFAGNYLPQKTGYHAYVGHWAETLDVGSKMAEAKAFYSGQLPRAAALAWLRKNHVRYVFEGFYETRAFPQRVSLLSLLGQAVFTSPPTSDDPDGTRVYRVPDV